MSIPQPALWGYFTGFHLYGDEFKTASSVIFVSRFHSYGEEYTTESCEVILKNSTSKVMSVTINLMMVF
jgi:hypothetical protein